MFNKSPVRHIAKRVNKLVVLLCVLILLFTAVKALNVPKIYYTNLAVKNKAVIEDMYDTLSKWCVEKNTTLIVIYDDGYINGVKEYEFRYFPSSERTSKFITDENELFPVIDSWFKQFNLKNLDLDIDHNKILTLTTEIGGKRAIIYCADGKPFGSEDWFKNVITLDENLYYAEYKSYQEQNTL